MPNINLATEDISRKNSSPMGKGLFFSIILLVLVIVLYGGLLITNKILSSKISEAENEYNIEYDKFLSGDGNEIIDFESRSQEAEKIITEGKSAADILSQVEKTMIPSVYVNSFKYDKNKNTISLICVADSFQTMSKQILSFKQDKYFSVVIPKQGSLDPKENNKIIFNIDLQVK